MFCITYRTQNEEGKERKETGHQFTIPFVCIKATECSEEKGGCKLRQAAGRLSLWVQETDILIF